MVEEAEGAIVPAPGTSGLPANPFAAAAVAAPRAYAADALAPATLRAYAADWRHFCAWCAEAGCAPLPAPPTAVAASLASLAGLYSRAALDRRLAAIGQQHRLRGLAWSAGDPAIRTTLQGIARQHGSRRRQAAALTSTELRKAVAARGGGPAPAPSRGADLDRAEEAGRGLRRRHRRAARPRPAAGGLRRGAAPLRAGRH